MPNWCSNSMVVRHSDPKQLTRFRTAFEAGSLLNEFVPCPKELTDTVAGSFGDEEKQAELETRQAENLKKFGYPTWYEFCVNEWGTKWDVGGTEHIVESIDDGVPGFRVYFDSAWSPPVAFYDRLSEQGFSISATYYEPGVGFVGEYSTDGGNDCYEFEYSIESIRENVPTHLDEEYGITESIEQDFVDDQDLEDDLEELRKELDLDEIEIAKNLPPHTD